jgi:mannose-6-phosphate isomerase
MGDHAMASADEMRQLLGKPIYLAPNTYLHFYNGGKLRATFMGEPDPKDDFNSEEWIFSTNRAITPGRDNPPDKGYSKVELPGGETLVLQQLLEAFPNETLGQKHFDRFGPNLGILVKIFDVGDDAHIPVHWHPSPEFATKHLDSPNGKNEAWVVIGTRPGAKAWIGWKEDVNVEDFRTWMEAQDVETMRAHMHEIAPKVGDVIFLRDSFVHSLGSGLCILEPQEPTDWNILAEWEGFPYDREGGTCGLGWDIALQAADFTAMPPDYLNNYVLRTPAPTRQDDGSTEYDLVPPEAHQYFNVQRILVGKRITMPGDRGFYCAIPVGDGEGKMVGGFGEIAIRRSKHVFIPANLGEYEIVNTGSGQLEVICCYPPKLD